MTNLMRFPTHPHPDENVCILLQESNKEQFMLLLKETFPNKFDESCGGWLPDDLFDSFKSVAHTVLEGSTTRYVRFEIKEPNSFADGIHFYEEWFPGHYIVWPPYIYCWWD